MNFEQNYVVELPSPVKKTYFDNSPYASILLLENGEVFVHKLTTKVYFKCSSYMSAKGLRQLIVDRCAGIDRSLNSRY